MPTPTLSVVIPVYNEELVLPTLFARLYPALDALGISYECVFVNDGSKDRSVALLRQQFERRPLETRVVHLSCEFRPALGDHGGIRLRARRLCRDLGRRFAESARRDRQARRKTRPKATTTSARSVSSARTRSGAARSPRRSTSCANGSRRCASPIRAA
jgi:glycosyltransferase involved in cell wall biosynthesis